MLSTHMSKKEHFYVYYLDTRNSIIKKELISLGSLNASIVHPREVFEPAIRHLCAHIILSHNHPSGDSTPSEADILVTKKLQNAGKILDIEVLDHVVVCEKDFTSMKEKGLM
jgi:DNA repair protein RadC